MLQHYHRLKNPSHLNCPTMASSSRRPSLAEMWEDEEPMAKRPRVDEPPKLDHPALRPAVAYGKWYYVAQEIAKAVQNGESDVALQLARIHWCGKDKELIGNS